MAVKTEICFFKPTGYSDTYISFHDDRGLSAQDAIKSSSEHERFFLNYISCSIVGDEEGLELILQKRARFLKSEKGPQSLQETYNQREKYRNIGEDFLKKIRTKFLILTRSILKGRPYV